MHSFVEFLYCCHALMSSTWNAKAGPRDLPGVLPPNKPLSRVILGRGPQPLGTFCQIGPGIMSGRVRKNDNLAHCFEGSGFS